MITAWVTSSPRRNSASSFAFLRIMAEMSEGEYSSSPRMTRTLSLVPCEGLTTLNWAHSWTFWISGSENPRPMSRLIDRTVSRGAMPQLS